MHNIRFTSKSNQIKDSSETNYTLTIPGKSTTVRSTTVGEKTVTVTGTLIIPLLVPATTFI